MLYIHVHVQMDLLTLPNYLHTYIRSPTGACPDGHVVLGVATDCYQSLNATRVRVAPGAYENVSSDLGLGGGFHWVLRFPTPVTADESRLSQNVAEKMMNNEI